VFGVALGTVLIEALARKGRRRIFPAAVGLETALLLLFSILRAKVEPKQFAREPGRSRIEYLGPWFLLSSSSDHVIATIPLL
jgi:hypothetical protein